MTCQHDTTAVKLYKMATCATTAVAKQNLLLSISHLQHARLKRILDSVLNAASFQRVDVNGVMQTENKEDPRRLFKREMTAVRHL